MTERPGDGDFERWLEHELRQAVAPIRGSRPRAAQAAYRTGQARRRPAASLGIRGMVAIAAAGLTLVGGVTGAAAVMGSPNPVTLGRLVVRAVRVDVPAATPAAPSVQVVPGTSQEQAPDRAGQSPAPSPTEAHVAGQAPDREQAQNDAGSQAQGQDQTQDQQGDAKDGARRPATHSPRPTPQARPQH